jgi:hypothetical protein
MCLNVLRGHDRHMHAHRPITDTHRLDDIELYLDGHVVLLRGNVIETFSPVGTHDALHVRHVAVEAKPTRGGDIVVRIGIDVSGTIVDGVRLRIDAAEMVAFSRLVDEAKRRREVLALTR